MAGKPRSETAEGWQDRHPEVALLLKMSVLLAAIIEIKSACGPTFKHILWALPGFYLLVLFLKLLTSDRGVFNVMREHVSVLDVPTLDDTDRAKGFPLCTCAIIGLNVLIFYFFITPGNEAYIENNLLFVPMKPNWANIPASLFSSMFLHADTLHLWGNMLFLWAFGSAVERRVGPGVFACLYVLGDLGGNLASFTAYDIFGGTTVHSLGASGAISGIMGVYLVRCYFKTMAFPIPLLGFLPGLSPVNFKVKMNSFIVIGFFFAQDLGRGMAQLEGLANTNIGHWSHLGGMAAGVLAAMLLGLQRQAVEERHMDIGTLAWDGNFTDTRKWRPGLDFAEAEKSLHIVLAKNHNNTEALIYLARVKKVLGKQARSRDLYNRAVTRLVQERDPLAVDIFREYNRAHGYRLELDSKVLYSLAGMMQLRGFLELAEAMYRRVAENTAMPVIIREKALASSVSILQSMGHAGAAGTLAGRFVRMFPASHRCGLMQHLAGSAHAA